MSSSTVTLRTRRVMTNRLLNRKQMVCNQNHIKHITYNNDNTINIMIQLNITILLQIINHINIF